VIERIDVDGVACEQAPERLFRVDRHIARHHADANVRRGDQGLQQGCDAGVKNGFVAVEVGQRLQQALPILLAELLAQVVRELAQPAQILEQLAPSLEAFEIADGHAMAQKTLLDRMEGVDGRAVGVEDDQLISVWVGAHAAKLSEHCDERVTVLYVALLQARFVCSSRNRQGSDGVQGAA
jgi:hypothetical protein